MPHGAKPLSPILVLPTEVVASLVSEGLVAPSRNPLGEFSAGAWWLGLLSLSGAAGGSVTLIEKGASIYRGIAHKVHAWNEHRLETQSEPSKGVLLHFKTASGMATLDLDKRPTTAALTAWFEASWSILQNECDEARAADGCPCHLLYDQTVTGRTEYFRRVISRFGGCAVDASKYLIAQPQPESGFGGVAVRDSMESFMIEPRFRCLFSSDETDEAFVRLTNANYSVADRRRSTPTGPDCPLD